MKPIYILHDNEQWVTPLTAAFSRLNITPVNWFINEGAIDLDQQPPDAIFYNRMSASSHTRGHRYAPELTQAILNWLESHQRTVINGHKALYMEISKVAQYTGLKNTSYKNSTISVPRTIAVVGKQKLLENADAFGFPLILKPNRGGKGLGVQLFKQKSSLENYLQSNKYQIPLDGIWLIQQYIAAANPYIMRYEFVGGKFLYAVKVSTEQGFELCPADVCQVDDNFCPVIKAVENNRFSISAELYDTQFIHQAELFLKNSSIEIAAIEVIKDQSGRLYAYDVNTNTNYNAEAEITANIPLTGMDAIAQYLSKLAEQPIVAAKNDYRLSVTTSNFTPGYSSI